MKKLLIAISLTPFLCFGQNPVDTISYNISSVFEVKQADAGLLQSRARVFIAEAFRSRKAVVQLDDTVNHVLVVRANIIPEIKTFAYGRVRYGRVNFLMELRFKNKKYKVNLSEFIHESDGPGVYSGGSLQNKRPACSIWNLTEGNWRKIKENVNLQISQLLIAMKTSIEQSGNDF